MSITELRKEMRFYRIAFWINAIIAIAVIWVIMPDLALMAKEYRRDDFGNRINASEQSLRTELYKSEQKYIEALATLNGQIMPSCFKGRE